MPGFILHSGATVVCIHGGQATPVAAFPRVLVSDQPITTLTSPYGVAGCGLPSAAGGPCVTAQWIVGAMRVLAGGAPVLVQSGVAVCVPTGTPLIVQATQSRVSAT